MPLQASAYSGYGDDNPFVEAMLRMMEIFGLIDRDRLPLSVPYLPGYGQQFAPGLGGFSSLGGLGGAPGMSQMNGLGGMPGMLPMYGLGGMPGMSPMYGLGGAPGMSSMYGPGGFPGMSPAPGMGGFPGAGGMPGGNWSNWGNLNQYPQAPVTRAPTYLDGIWELDQGGFVIIKGNNARLYVSREQYQDFAVRYDRQHLWWRPQEGGEASRYTYQAREGRMVLRDAEGNLLLLRRRR
jgi:hypothetical protein